MKELHLIEGLSKQLKQSKKAIDILNKQMDKNLGDLKELDPKQFEQFGKTRGRLEKALREVDASAALDILTELNIQHGPKPTDTK